MDAWTADLIKNASNVILGWVLGLGSAAFTDWRRERKGAKAIKTAISCELRETAQRLLCLIYKIEGRFGRLNREVLEWMKPQIQKYAGPNPKDGMLAGVTGLLAQSDQELSKLLAVHLQQTIPPHSMPLMPREEASYTAGAIGQLEKFDSAYAVRVLDILAHIRILNDARENGLYYARLTYEPGLSPENYGKAVANVAQADEQVAKRARIIVDKITALESKFPPDV